MSNVKISDLTAGVALTGAELFEMTQASNSRSTTAAAIVTLSATWTADQQAAGFDIKDISNVEFRVSTGAPAGTVRAIYGTAAGVIVNTITATSFDVQVNGTSEFEVDAAQADFKANNIVAVTNFTLTGVINFPDGVRQTFNPDGTNSGLNVGAHTADPSAPQNGDIFYNSTSNQLRARINGAWVELGAGGAPQTPWAQNIDAANFSLLNLGGLELENPANTFEYVFVTSAIIADRNVTLPLLTGNDIFVFEAFAQTLTNKTIAAASNTITIASTDLTDTADLVRRNAATTYTAGSRQDFLGLLAGTAGLNVGGIAGAPTTQANGDLWYDTNTNQLFGRINGANVDLGVQATEITTWTANHDANGFALEDPLFADPTDTTKRLDIDLAGNATTVVLTLDINQTSNQTLTVPNITGSDSIVTNAFAATLTNKTFNSGTSFTSAPSLADGVRWTFNPNNTAAGINVGANGTDPSSPVDGDIYYQTGVGFRIRDGAAWATLNQPDTPWTVLHDAARFNLDNTGAIIFSLSGPSAAPLVTDPYIAYDTSLAPDALVYNVPAAIEHRFHVNGVEEYTMTSTLFNGNGNIIQNFTSLQLSAVTPGPIIQLTNSSSSPAAGTTIAEIRWIGDTVSGGNVDYAVDRTVVRDNTSASPDGERQLLCETAGALVEYVALNHNALGLTFFAREISFTNGQGIVDPTFGREILTFTSVGTSAVNEVNIENALTTARPIIEVTGGDTNVGMEFRTKGEAPIVFADDDGAEEVLQLSQVTGSALNYIEITNSLTGNPPIFAAIGANGNIGLEFRVKAQENMLFTNDGNEEMLELIQVTGAATNFVEITNAITATGPIIAAAGSDTNVALNLTGKGTGSVVHQTSINTDVAGLLTIATGAVTKTSSFHRIAGEGGAADTLSTINGGNEGDILVLRSNDTADDITVDEAGNIVLESAGNFIMTNVQDTLTLIFDGTNWLELSRSDNTA